MNWASIVSGTDWTHATGFSVAAVIIVSSVSILASRLLRNLPALRHGLLRSSLMACLLAVIIGAVTGMADSPILGIGSPMITTTSGSIGSTSTTSWEVSLPASLEPAAVVMSSDPNSQGVPVTGSPQPSSLEAFPSKAGRHRIFGGSVFATLWFVGTVTLLLFGWRSHRRGWSIRNRCAIANSNRISECQQLAKHHAGLAHLPTILQSDEVHAPVVHGIRVPVVILPIRLADSISKHALTDVLVHEFAHIRRRDTVAVVVEIIARAILWPIVTVHWMVRELRQSREEVCDNFVLQHRDPVQYAETLLKLAEFACGREVPSPTIGILFSHGDLEQRVTDLLDSKRNRSCGLPPHLAIGLALLVGFCSVVLSGSRLVATEVVKPQAAPRDRSPVETPSGTEHHAVRVIDWKGNPVAGAKVRLWLIGFSAPGAGGGHRPPREDAFAGVTDKEGRISVPFPRIGGPDGLPTTSLGLEIEHPQHPRWFSSRSVDQREAIRLSRPVVVSIAASLASGEPVDASELYAVMQERESRWRLRDGRLTSGPVNVAINQLLVVHAPENGPASFSDVIDLWDCDIVQNRVEIDATLSRSVQLRGRLSDDIPLPIRAGRVIAMSWPSPGDSWATWWSATTTIAGDGTFVLDNLPPQRHVQLIALCDGGVSRSLRPSEVSEYCRQHDCELQDYGGVIPGKTAPQLYFAGRESAEITIPMEPTGDVEVTVRDFDAKPIANVEIQFSPNQRWYGGGNQMLGSGYDTLQFLKRAATRQPMPSYRDLASQSLRSFTAVTNAKGKAVVRNLPAGGGWFKFQGRERPTPSRQSFTATHESYVLPASQLVGNGLGFRASGINLRTVEMIPNGTAKVDLRMQRKRPPGP